MFFFFFNLDISTPALSDISTPANGHELDRFVKKDHVMKMKMMGTRLVEYIRCPGGQDHHCWGHQYQHQHLRPWLLFLNAHEEQDRNGVMMMSSSGGGRSRKGFFLLLRKGGG